MDSCSGIIQTKLTIGQPGDKYEKEADAISDQVMRMPDPQIQRQTTHSEEEEMTMLKAQSPSVQMKCAGCEKEEKESLQRKPLARSITPFFQRKETGEGEVSGEAAAFLQSAKGGGQPLPDDTRSWMENRFGTDFSRVQVHTDAAAVQMSRELNAKAFTHGSDIYFNRGEFAPGTNEGKRLLAHELTHVVQQQGTIQRQPKQTFIDEGVLGRTKDQEDTLLPGYTQCDFLDERISHEAQFALYHLYKRGGIDRHTSLSILGAVKNNQMQGIYKEDQGKPALMARRHGSFWWQLIPQGQGAIVFEPELPPMMVFKNNIANNRAALGDALRNAWDTSSLSEKAIIIPPPSLKLCPLIPPPPPSQKKDCSIGMIWDPVSESCECQPGTFWDPVSESCILDLPGTVKTECTEAEMADEFQRQQDFCAGIRSAIDIACSQGASPCDIAGPFSKAACALWKSISGKALPGSEHPACSEPRSEFYEKCTVSTIIGGRDSMPCYPGSGTQILDKYRKWPGRIK